MLTDKFLEESGDDVSNDFSTLETLLLIWMGLRLRNLASLKVKTAIKSGIAMTVSNIFSRLKDTDSQTSKKDMMNRSDKNLNKGIKDTQGEIRNLCNISRKCTNKQFMKACDEAYSKIVSGNDVEKAIDSSIRKLSQKGIEVIGYTDYSTSMDVAVRRAVTSGVNQSSLKFKMDNCKELGINIVKTSSHGGARPSHQEWQGKVFYLHTPVKGLQNFKKATGYGRVDGLGGANCRHSFYEVTDYEYKNSPFDTEEFDKNRNDDQYKLEQKQRYYERQIRSWKKRKNILDECGVDSTKEAKKIREWQDKRSQFIKESNIQFKKEHGVDNVLKKAYTREKVVMAERSTEEALKILKKTSFNSDKKEFEMFSKILKSSIMPKSIEEYQNMKYTDIDRYKAIQLDVKNVNLQNEIIKTYNLSLREGQQGKHILGHNNYLKGRSYISNATMEEIQQCISTHAGKGIIQRTANGNWNNKELIIDENMEGYVIDIDGNLILTHRFMIHYSKDKGTYLVPTLRKE